MVLTKVTDPHVDMLDGMRKAFGAPGDYGYGTKEGQALAALYSFLASRDGQDTEAARYRFLRENHARFWTSTMGGPDTLDIDFEGQGHDLDAAVDAAMAAYGKLPEGGA